mgnify:FL=1
MNNITVAIEEQDDHMAKVKIYVNGLSPVLIGGRTKYQRIRLNAGTLPVKDWDHRLNRPSMAFSKRDGGVLHRTIDMICLNAQRAYMEAPMKTAGEVRERYDTFLGKKKLVERRSTYLTDVVQGWIEKGGRSAHTIHTYIVFKRKVEAFERNDRAKLDLGKATLEELEDFLRWVQVTDKLAPNTMATQQKFLNMALNELRESGLPVAKRLKSYAFKTPKKDVLDWSELARVFHFQPRNRTEANAQTILVGLCLSGVRISDTYLLFKSIARRGPVLCADFVQTKNSERHPVTVSPIIFEPIRVLIERNGPPDRISEKHIRVSTKRLLKAVGVEKEVQVHSFRRSFVGLFLSIGISDWVLAKLNTGHIMSASGNGRGMLHSYNHAGMMITQRTMIEMLRLVDIKQTGGLQLLSEEVCPS